MSVSGNDLIIDEIGEPALIVLSNTEYLVRRYIVTYFFEATAFKKLVKRLNDRLGLVKEAGETLVRELENDAKEQKVVVKKLVEQLRGQIGYQTKFSKNDRGRDLVVLLGIVPFELSPGSIVVTYKVTRIEDPPPHP
jgi:hypothetical protein